MSNILVSVSGVGASLISFVIGLNCQTLATKYLNLLPHISMLAVYGTSWVLGKSRIRRSILLSLAFFFNVIGRSLQMVGLTGGISCGKSTVVNMIKEISPQIAIIDSDLIAREVVKPGKRAYK